MSKVIESRKDLEDQVKKSEKRDSCSAGDDNEHQRCIYLPRVGSFL